MRKKPISAYPQFGNDEASFEVMPDFSCEALGGVLEQEQEGQRQFIGAAGRKTTPGEKNYPPTKGELCAVVNILRKYEHILCYKGFVVHCDHQPLKWLRKMKNPKGIYWQWLQELETYDFEIRYKPGKKIGAADRLSRSPHMCDPTPEEVAESKEFVGHMGTDGDNKNLEAIRLDREHIQKAREADEVLQEVQI